MSTMAAITALLFLCICRERVAEAQQVRCRALERDALESFKAAITEDPTGALRTWTGPECCAWDAILCDRTSGAVQNLILRAQPQQHMCGSLSPSLANLSSLRTVVIAGWKCLNSDIPSSMSSITSLTHLTLDNNNLTGHIPPRVFQLTNLRTLSLTGNMLSGRIPEANMPNLQSLFLEGNMLSGSVPESFGSLTSLTELKLDKNELSGALPRSITSLASLLILDVSQNRFTGQLPVLPAKLAEFLASDNGFTGGIPEPLPANLTKLVLKNNNISDPLPDSISDLHSLTVVDLSENRVSGRIPEFQRNGNLNSLLLNGNRLEGSIPESLGKHSSLRLLNLGFNNLNGQISPSFGAKSLLQTIILAGNDLSGTIPQVFSEMEYLQYLDLSSNNFTGPLPNSSALYNLDYLNLSRNSFSGPVPELEGIGLETLDLSYINLSLESIPSWVTLSSFLTDLRLAGCNISMVLEYWTPDSPFLYQTLDLSDNQLGGELAGFLDNNFTALRSLNLRKNILNGSIPVALEALKQLEFLDLSENQLSGGIPEELKSLENLKYLNVSYNHLCGKIPKGPPFDEFPASAYDHNDCLCGTPLPPCP